MGVVTTKGDCKKNSVHAPNMSWFVFRVPNFGNYERERKRERERERRGRGSVTCVWGEGKRERYERDTNCSML